MVTYAAFEVERTRKGNPVPEVTVVTPGGSVGSVHQSTVGIPVFHPGAEHVLFVKNSSLGPTVLYFDQGAYDVTTNDRGEKLLTPLPTSLVKVHPQPGMPVPPTHTPNPHSQFA